MKLKNLIFILFLIGWNLSLAQEASEELLKRARVELDSLCSERLGGRGYIDDGHIRAADYVEKRFTEIGLKKVEKLNGYQQSFPLTINRIEDASLILNKKKLKPGDDFIVNRYSGAGKLKGKVVDLGYALEESASSLSGKIALFRNGWPEEIANDAEKKKQYQDRANSMDRLVGVMRMRPSGIIVVENKLTAGFAKEQFPIPVVELKADVLPKKIKNAEISVKTEVTEFQSQNVIGVIPGTTHPDSFLIVSAHYDHLGKLGPAIFTGANDNASGTTMMLSMAEYFTQPGKALPYSLLFIAFGGEETGLVGSNYYVNSEPVVPLEPTKFILNLDLMGNGIEGIMAVGGRDYPGFFDQLKQLNEGEKYVPKVRARTNAPNSDHYFFLQNGVPGFFIYTLGGPPHYHDVNDNPSTIELSKYVEVRELLIRFLEEID